MRLLPARRPIAARSSSACACLLGLILLSGLPAEAQDLYHDIPGDPLPGGRDEEVCWFEEEDLQGIVISSNIVSDFGIESEVANDFVIDHDATITQARWVGGYYCYLPGDPLLTSMNLRFYDEAGCAPGNVIVEVIIPNNANENFIDEGDDCVLLGTYWYDVSVPVLAGVTYWFGAQGGDHPFPPQWGRLSTLAVTGCEGMFLSRFFGYPEWTRISQMEGFDQPYDFSQEFVCGEPIAVDPRSWGAIKGLYESEQ